MTPNRFSPAFLRAFRQNPLKALSAVTSEDAPVSRLSAGPFRCFIVTDPEVGVGALTGSGHTYRRTPDLAFWFPPAGEGVASSPHEKWLRQRRLLAPFFKASTEPALAEVTAQEVERLIQRIASQGDSEFDLQALTMEATLRIAVQHLLVRPFPGESAPISAAIQTAMHYATPGRAIQYRILGQLNRALAKRVLHPRPKRAALSILDDFVDRLIGIARANPGTRAPMMAALLEAEASGVLDPGELRDQVATFLVAAVDSVGSAITWTMWHLASRPDEATRAAGSSVRAEACVLESMRLVPPLWIYWREVREPHPFAGVDLRRGDLVVFVPFVVHMRPEIWPEPERFDPTRFLTGDAISGEGGYAYMPFGHGAHACLGRRMAMTEARTVVHALCRRFNLHISPQTASQGDSPVEVRVAVLMKGGLWVRATPG